MPSDYLGLSAADVVARLVALASAAAGGKVTVRLGDEGIGCRNVGIDLPRERRSAAATRLLRQRVRGALERNGVILAETALAPPVGGDIRGSVRVRVVEPTHKDAAHMLFAPQDHRRR